MDEQQWPQPWEGAGFGSLWKTPSTQCSHTHTHKPSEVKTCTYAHIHACSKTYIAAGQTCANARAIIRQHASASGLYSLRPNAAPSSGSSHHTRAYKKRNASRSTLVNQRIGARCSSSRRPCGLCRRMHRRQETRYYENEASSSRVHLLLHLGRPCPLATPNDVFVCDPSPSATGKPERPLSAAQQAWCTGSPRTSEYATRGRHSESVLDCKAHLIQDSCST